MSRKWGVWYDGKDPADRVAGWCTGDDDVSPELFDGEADARGSLWFRETCSTSPKHYSVRVYFEGVPMTRADDMKRAAAWLDYRNNKQAPEAQDVADLIATVRAEAYEAAAIACNALVRPERMSSSVSSHVNDALRAAADRIRALARESAK